MFGYFPAPFVFGGVADSDKLEPILSMRYAIGSITYWSILAGIFLTGATVINFTRRDVKDSETNDSVDTKESY